MRASRLIAVLSLTGMAAAACADGSPTATEGAGSSRSERPSPLASASLHGEEPPPPILIEPLTGRHEFTDQVAAQIRLKADGRAQEVINLQDASRIAVLRITVQPGVRFPWHTHPGPVIAAVTNGLVVYVDADDCVEREYGQGTAFVDPGNDVHFAFNPTEEETVIIATFLGVPPAGALTVPVAAAEQTALDAKCGVPAP